MPLVQSVCYHSGLSCSLAPPPLDDDLPLSERLEQVKTCLSQSSSGHRKSVLVTYDIIQAYKVLVLSCGISLEGNCEDPKVRQIIKTAQLALRDNTDYKGIFGVTNITF